MTLELGRYISRTILKPQIFDFVTREPIMTFDYANTAETSQTATTVYANGAGTRRASFSGEKELALAFSTQVFSMEHLAMLSGEKFTSGSANVYKNEILKVETGKVVNLTQTPVGGATNIFVRSYVNGVLGEKQEVDTANLKVVTLDTDATAVVGSEVSVYYQFSATSAKTLEFTVDGFPPYVFIAGDTLYTDEISGKIVDTQITYYKAKLQPNFTIANSSTGDPSSLDLTFDLFPIKKNGVDTLMGYTMYELPN